MLIKAKGNPDKGLPSLAEHTRALLFGNSFPPKKKLGQNFIIDRASLERIVRAAELTKSDIVLEIGTGLGSLTRALARAASKVISVEYDKILFGIASEELKDLPNVVLLRDDILKIDLSDVLKKEAGGKRYKVVANVPYYITAPIITKLIGTKPSFSLAVLTVQKEVAERITAGPGTGEYGSLSIYVQYHMEAAIDSLIPPSAFLPHPAVSSAVLVLKPRITPPVRVSDEDRFFDIVHAALEHRRKTLRNSIILSRKLGITKERIDGALKKCGIDGERRGETLSIDEFASLAEAL